jgi:hypothetical protein
MEMVVVVVVMMMVPHKGVVVETRLIWGVFIVQCVRVGRDAHHREESREDFGIATKMGKIIMCHRMTCVCA